MYYCTFSVQFQHHGQGWPDTVATVPWTVLAYAVYHIDMILFVCPGCATYVLTEHNACPFIPHKRAETRSALPMRASTEWNESTPDRGRGADTE